VKIMLEISKNSKLPDIALDPINVEVSALDSVLVLPPIGKLVMGKPISMQGQSLTKNYDSLTDIAKDILMPELKSLLRSKDRFLNSSTYLAKLSGVYQACGDTALATVYASKAKEINSSPVFLQRLGDTFLKANNPKEALNIFSDLRTKGYIDSHLRLAEFAINNQNFTEATKLVDEALSLDNLDWKVRLLAGTLALTRKEFEQAIRHYRIAIESKPNSSVLRLNIAISHYLLGHPKKALREAQKAVAVSPLNLNALIFLADIVLKESGKSETKNLSTLQRHLESYFLLMPIDKGLISRLADVYLSQGKINEGIELLDKNKDQINDPVIWNNLGVFWSSKKNELAVKYYQQSIENVGGIKHASLNRGSSFATLNLVNLLMNNKKYIQAEAILKTFVQNTVNTEYLEDEVLCKVPVAMLRAYVHLDKVMEAVNLAENLLKNPDLHILGRLDFLAALTTYHSFVTLKHNLSVEFAREAVNLAMEFKSEVPFDVINLAKNNLACALLESGSIDEARQLIEQLQVNSKNSEYIYATKGLYSLHTGHIDRAKGFFQQAISLAENEKKDAIRLKMNFELGKFCYINLDYQHAKFHFKKVVDAKNVRDGWSFKELQIKSIEILNEMQLKNITKH
jgi:tetratricopeptide (TPR) repeat protein